MLALIPRPRTDSQNTSGWYGRLHVEVDVIGTQLCSIARAIFPCVALFGQDCSNLRKLMDYCQTQKRSTI